MRKANKTDVNLYLAMVGVSLAMSLAVLFGGCTTAQRQWIVNEIDDWAYEKNEERPNEQPDIKPPIDKPDTQPHPIAGKVSKWHGENYSGAVIDPNYQLTVSSDGRNWSAMPSDWTDGGNMLFPAICVMVWKRPDGSYAGGKYEWLPNPPRPRDWKNIHNGYSGWEAPPSGTVVQVFAFTHKGGRASNPVEVIFK